jgi:hypothetical protein
LKPQRPRCSAYQMLARRRLVPIKEPTEATNKTDAHPSARSGLATCDASEIVS